MEIPKILLAILAISTFSLSISSNSSDRANNPVTIETASAKCRVPPFKEAYAGAKAVFVGEVVTISQNERGKTFEFKVEKYWKGSRSKKATVLVYESSRFQAFYQAGQEYLVFASDDGENGLRDGRCSRSNRIADAAADMKLLGKAKRPR